MMKYSVNTIKDLIDSLGGPSALARWAGTEPSAISNWEARGFIPPAWHLRLMLLAAQDGIDIRSINPELFAMMPAEMDFLFASLVGRADETVAA